MFSAIVVRNPFAQTTTPNIKQYVWSKKHINMDKIIELI